MDDIINQIAEIIGEAEDGPEDKVNPMARSSDGRHKDRDDDPSTGGIEMTGGERPPKHDPSGRPFRHVGHQITRPYQGKEDVYDESTYQDKRRRAVSQIKQAAAVAHERGTFQELRDALMRNKVGGFDVLKYFDVESGMRSNAKSESDRGYNNEEYVVAIHESGLLNSYTATPAVRKRYGAHPFKIEYERKRKNQETGLWETVRDIGDEIHEAVRQERKIRTKLENLKVYQNNPNLMRAISAKYKGLSSEQIKVILNNKATKLYTELKNLENDTYPYKARYESFITEMAEEYRNKIDNLKAVFVRGLPRVISHVLNKTWPQDYPDWLRTSKTTLGPVTDDDIADVKRSAGDPFDQTIYSIKILKTGEVKEVGAEEARGKISSGEAIRLPRQEERPSEESPDTEASAEKHSANLELYTIPEYDDDGKSGNTVYCSYCSEGEEEDVGKGSVFHHNYSEFGTWNEVLGTQYEPDEKVLFVYSIGNDIRTAEIRRHEISERDLLNDPDLSYAQIYPLTPTVNAINKDNNKIVSLTANQYQGYYAAQRKVSNKKPGRTLSAQEQVAMRLILPISRQTGGALTADEIASKEYDSVDKNGGTFENITYTNLKGEEEPYAEYTFAIADEYIKSLRTLLNIEGQTTGRDNNLVFDSSTGVPLNLWDYKKELDPGKGKMPSEALHIRLPETPDSFRQAFGQERPNLLEVGYNGPFLVVKEFPWAVQEDDVWKLNVAKNYPLGDAVRKAHEMWVNHNLPDEKSIKTDDKGWQTIVGVEDPNNIKMTIYRQRERRMIDILRNIGKRDISHDIQGSSCTNDVRDKETGHTEICGNPASHNYYPQEVALITDKDGEATWNMVSREEATAHQELYNLQSGRPSNSTQKSLENTIDRKKGMGSKIPNYGGLCDSCWLAEWEIVPEALVKTMFDELGEISEKSSSWLLAFEHDELDVAKQELMNLIDKWVNMYMIDGSFWAVILAEVKKSKLAPNIKDNLLNNIERHYQNLEDAIHKFYDPSVGIIDAVGEDPKSGKPWFSRYVDAIMVQLKQFYMWLYGYRLHRYEHKDVQHTRMDPETYIIPFSRIDRPDVRNARALSRAMHDDDRTSRKVRWGRANESIINNDRVIIDGLIGEEAYYNGLLGYIVDKQDGMCVVKLDMNNKTFDEHIKVYQGELNIIWETNKKPSPEDQYDKLIKESRLGERLKNDIISAIGDATSESPYW